MFATIEKLFVKTAAGKIVGPFANSASARAEVRTAGGTMFYQVVPL